MDAKKNGIALVIFSILKVVLLYDDCDQGVINNICHMAGDFQNDDFVYGKINTELPINMTLIRTGNLNSNFFTNRNSPQRSSQVIALNLHFEKITDRTMSTIQQQLGQLQELYLENNNLTAIPSAIFKFSGLKILHLDYNFLTNIKETSLPSNLKRLHLNNNKISVFRYNELSQLEELYLQHNNLDSVENGFFENFQKLKILYIAHNFISHVKENSFPQSLEELYINSNKITIFQNNVFPNLKRLDMSNNPFQFFGTIGLLSILVVNMSSCNIDLINYVNGNIILNESKNGKIIINPKYLQELDLSENQIEVLNISVFSECHSLHYLNFRNNFVKFSPEYVDPTIILNSTLNYANFADNLIKFLDLDWFLSSDNLTHLHFENNKIHSVNISKFTGRQLKAFNLSNNCISKISHADVLNLNDLTELDLSNNSLDESIIEIFSNKTIQLGYLNLAFNKINFITQYLCRNCNKLKYVYLNNNRINMISNYTFSNLTEMIFLDMQYNNIKHLPAFLFKDCNNLIRLNLSNNNIIEIRQNAFAGLNNLIDLNLKNNRIFVVVGIFIHLSSLKTLDLSGNFLKVIHYGIFDDLVELNYLNLSHNQLEEVNEFTFTYMKHLNELYLDNNKLSSLNVEYLTTVKKLSLFNNRWNCENLRRNIESLQQLGISDIISAEKANKNVEIKLHSINRIACEKEFVIVNNTKESFTNNDNYTALILWKYLDYFNNTLVKVKESLTEIKERNNNHFDSSTFKDSENKNNSTNIVYNILFIIVSLSTCCLLIYLIIILKKQFHTQARNNKCSETVELM